MASGPDGTLIQGAAAVAASSDSSSCCASSASLRCASAFLRSFGLPQTFLLLIIVVRHGFSKDFLKEFLQHRLCYFISICFFFFILLSRYLLTEPTKSKLTSSNLASISDFPIFDFFGCFCFAICSCEDFPFEIRRKKEDERRRSPLIC
jgi:hypothetical protein